MSRPVAFVTGAKRGIGRAIAEAFAAAGYDLVLADLGRDDEAEAACAAVARHGGQAAFEGFDIADLATHEPALDRIQARFGRLDCLVANAGIGAPVRGDPLDLEPANFDAVMNVNLRGTLFLTQKAVRRMLAAPDPAIHRALILISSVSAELATPDRADYCISKAALAMWTKTLALRLAETSIGVYEIRPGIIRTEMTAQVSGRYDRLIAEGRVPARRWGERSDVASVAVALAGGAFGFASGSVVNVDGGLAIPRL
jgi:3-oxoacyl-[acyl-carrier protein] reductase